MFDTVNITGAFPVYNPPDTGSRRCLHRGVVVSGEEANIDVMQDAQFMENLRRQMLRFASLQIADFHLAEDAVQEALLGAFRNAGSFAGRSQVRSWVFAILKNKIVDVLRKHQRLVTVGSSESDSEDELAELLFNQKGHWVPDEQPADWGNPHQSLNDTRFWTIFEACLENLPAGQSRVFMMREFMELESTEICTLAGLSVSNLNVLLYRARLRLRECLENRWFAGEA